LALAEILGVLVPVDPLDEFFDVILLVPFVEELAEDEERHVAAVSDDAVGGGFGDGGAEAVEVLDILGGMLAEIGAADEGGDVIAKHLGLIPCDVDLVTDGSGVVDHGGVVIPEALDGDVIAFERLEETGEEKGIWVEADDSRKHSPLAGDEGGVAVLKVAECAFWGPESERGPKAVEVARAQAGLFVFAGSGRMVEPALPTRNSDHADGMVGGIAVVWEDRHESILGGGPPRQV